MSIKNIYNHILDLVFPINCLMCHFEGVYICERCLLKLKRLEKQKCIVCQKPAPFGKTHTNCLTKYKLDGIISGMSYHDSTVKQMIEIFKYHFVSDLSNYISKVLAQTIADSNLNNFFADFAIVPIPLHKRRLTWRGFNQAQLLAESVSTQLKIECNSNLVSRIKNTKPQVKLGVSERKTNIQNAFAVHPPLPKKILLVDDVVTTGSTILEVAKVLKKNGCQEVWAITAAAD